MVVLTMTYTNVFNEVVGKADRCQPVVRKEQLTAL